jgi:hypothetical protein
VSAPPGAGPYPSRAGSAARLTQPVARRTSSPCTRRYPHQDRPIRPRGAGPANLATQYRDLVPQRQQLGNDRGLAAYQDRQQPEQAHHHQIEESKTPHRRSCPILIFPQPAGLFPNCRSTALARFWSGTDHAGDPVGSAPAPAGPEVELSGPARSTGSQRPGPCGDRAAGVGEPAVGISASAANATRWRSYRNTPSTTTLIDRTRAEANVRPMTRITRSPCQRRDQSSVTQC